MPVNMEIKHYLLNKILTAVLMGDVQKADKLREQYLSLDSRVDAQIDSEVADFHANHYWHEKLG